MSAFCCRGFCYWRCFFVLDVIFVTNVIFVLNDFAFLTILTFLTIKIANIFFF